MFNIEKSCHFKNRKKDVTIGENRNYNTLNTAVVYLQNRKQTIIDEKIKNDPQFPVVRELSNETLRKIYRKKDEGGKDGEEEEEEEVEETVLEGPGCR